MRSLWRGLVGVGAILGIVSTAGAQQEVYNTLGWFTPSNAWNLTNTAEAMNFTLSEDAVISEAKIWTTHQGGVVDPNYGFRGQFDWTIFTDANGMPGAVVASGSSIPTRVSQTVRQDGFDTALWDFAIAPTALTGGQQYWFGVHNTDDTHDYIPNNGFYWIAGNTVTPYPGMYQVNGEGPWIPNQIVDADWLGYGNRPTLGLYGTTTPEPASLALFGTCLVGLAPVLRKRRKAMSR